MITRSCHVMMKSLHEQRQFLPCLGIMLTHPCMHDLPQFPDYRLPQRPVLGVHSQDDPSFTTATKCMYTKALPLSIWQVSCSWVSAMAILYSGRALQCNRDTLTTHMQFCLDMPASRTCVVGCLQGGHAGRGCRAEHCPQCTPEAVRPCSLCSVQLRGRPRGKHSPGSS